MASSNFSFLTGRAEPLVKLGGLAERYFRTDANTALIKLRQFCEVLTEIVAAHVGQYRAGDNLIDLLRRLECADAIPRESARLFHELRINGNKAAHNGYADHAAALSCLKFAWQLGVWYHRSYGGHPNFQPPPFAPPPDPRIASLALKTEMERLRQAHTASLTDVERAKETARQAEEARLSAEERSLRDAEEHEALRRQLENLEAEKAALRTELERLQAAAVAAPPQALAFLTTAAQTAAAAIDLDEAATRNIIDSQLRDRGWEADSQELTYRSGARPAKGRNMAIAEWPTDTGPADYALFIGMTLVGVVEAKRKRKNVSAAIDQAERYSAGIRLPEGVEALGPWGDFRAPFLFATNGRPYLKQIETESGIWFRDARKSTRRRRALMDWYTPTGLRELIGMDQDAAQTALAAKPFDFGFDLRPYQRRAIEKVESALADDRRAMLVAMATGTGKTKLAIAMLSRLLETKRFRRVCFVVDRNILGGQTADEFKTTKIMGVRTFAEVFGVQGLKETSPDDATKVHVCTVQALAKRVLAPGDDGAPPVDQYDLLVIDECHRGYLLDRELSDDELAFRDQSEYISKYRRVLEYFDAVKIGLTATPALHTVEIFGRPVFTYTYREAVIDRYLIDHEPPIQITTALAAAGIRFQRGERLELLNTTSGEVTETVAPDELAFDVETFNRSVITKAFNEAVATALAQYIDPTLPDKTLIFAVSDGHADMVVEAVKQALEDAYGEIDDADVRKITGSVDRPRELTLKFRNDPQPKIAVTVDLLTTGVDIPKITNLVFLRRVNSRILYEQMLGRATRKCDEIGKETFRIFDAVDLYPTLETMTDMKPVGVAPKRTFEQLFNELATATDDRHRELVRDELETKLRRNARTLHDAARAKYLDAAGEGPEDTLHRLTNRPLAELSAWFAGRAGLGAVLDWRPDRPGQSVPISQHPDQLLTINHGYGRDGSLTRPEDFLEAFAAWIRDNVNTVAALSVLVNRPRDLTRADLRAIRLALDEQAFTDAALHRAWAQAKNEDIVASVIGHIRQAALGDPLRPYADRVKDALARLLRSRAWTPVQRKWLERIGKDVTDQLVIDRDFLNEGQYKANIGGFDRLNKVFDGRLETVIADLQEDVWRKTG